MSFNGILGPPIYDHTVPPGDEASFGPSGIAGDAVVLRGSLKIRSKDAGTSDTVILTIEGDTDDNNYDGFYKDLSATGQDTDDTREWFDCPGQHSSLLTPYKIWADISFSIVGYQLLIKHAVSGFGITGVKGTPSYQMRDLRHHVAAPITGLSVSLLSGADIEAGSRMTLWKEIT